MRLATLLLICCCTTLHSQDTFSIIAADPVTGEIGAAGATCVDGIAAFGGIQLLNKIIPGRGGVNAQAAVCLNPHINLDNAIAQLEAGSSPEEIIAWLLENDACFSQNFDPSYRQYGIVDFDSNGNIRTTAFTGDNTTDFHGDRTGATYAIQGNILLGPEVLDGMEEGFNNTDGSLAQRLMAAMQGANFAGADSRCLDRGTSSTSSFLRVVRPTDDPAAPYLELNVLETPFGVEPIDSLQTLFDEWELLNNLIDIDLQAAIEVYPNPSDGAYTLSLPPGLEVQSLRITSTTGQQIWQLKTMNARANTIDLTKAPSGLYWLSIQLPSGQTVTRKLVKL